MIEFVPIVVVRLFGIRSYYFELGVNTYRLAFSDD